MGLLNPENTNLENGITNRKDSALFGSMGMPDPTKFITHWDDFHTLPTFANSTGNYTAPITGTASGASGLDGGLVLITGGAPGDSTIIRTQMRRFDIIQSFPVYFRSSEVISDVAKTVFIAGLTEPNIDTSPQGGVFFQKLDDVDTLDLVIIKNDIQVIIAPNISTVSDNVPFTTEFFWDGGNNIYYGVNGFILGSVDIGSVLPFDFLAPTMGIESGVAGGAKVIKFNYIFANRVRDS